jgi:hypothetical protein
VLTSMYPLWFESGSVGTSNGVLDGLFSIGGCACALVPSGISPPMQSDHRNTNLIEAESHRTFSCSGRYLCSAEHVSVRPASSECLPLERCSNQRVCRSPTCAVPQVIGRELACITNVVTATAFGQTRAAIGDTAMGLTITVTVTYCLAEGRRCDRSQSLAGAGCPSIVAAKLIAVGVYWVAGMGCCWRCRAVRSDSLGKSVRPRHRPMIPAFRLSYLRQ